jgi:hypothetical protein
MEVIHTREILANGLYPAIINGLIGDTLSLFAYGFEHPGRRKKVPMNVDEMVDKWAPLVKKLALAHDVDEKDLASSQLDDLLKPIVIAPVKEIREFYKKLTKKLKDDQTVPWALWRLFEHWGANVLDKIDKEEVEGLKKEMALKITEMSMDQIPKQDWVDAMVGALEWRSVERLKEIEQGIAAGKPPRVRGKESCLFLEVGEARVML